MIVKSHEYIKLCDRTTVDMSDRIFGMLTAKLIGDRQLETKPNA
ncbi:hypothetical protein [Allocoleopsis sp.]